MIRTLIGIRCIPALSAALFFLGGGCGDIRSKFGRKAEEAGHGTTRVSFTQGDKIATADVLVGGVMVYAVSSSAGISSEAFYFTSESAASTGATLPNGNYQFYSLGYSATKMDSPSGDVRCGTNGSSVTLDGTSTTIPITLNVSNCANSQFSDAANADATFGLKQMQFLGCHSGTMANGMSTSFCGPPTGFTSVIGSVKLVFNSYTNQNDTSSWQNAISSDCIPTGASAFPSTSAPRVPQAVANSFIAMTVLGYSDASCGTVFDTYTFPQGIENAASPSGRSAYDAPGSPPNPSGPGYLLLQDF